MNKFKPLARRGGVIIQEFGKEILVYDLATNKAFNLNETSSLIWQLSTGNNTISEIAKESSKKLGSPINEEFVWFALDELKKSRLIENMEEVVGIFENTSRRQVIKRIGLGTFAAFPIVSTLIAPTAINAQSQSCSTAPFTNGCPCIANGNCSSACCGVSGIEVCVSFDATPVGSPCRGNCECAGASTCPSCIGLPRVCRIGGCPP